MSVIAERYSDEAADKLENKEQTNVMFNFFFSRYAPTPHARVPIERQKGTRYNVMPNPTEVASTPRAAKGLPPPQQS
jgi:hypothetical protein